MFCAKKIAQNSGCREYFYMRNLRNIKIELSIIYICTMFGVVTPFRGSHRNIRVSISVKDLVWKFIGHFYVRNTKCKHLCHLFVAPCVCVWNEVYSLSNILTQTILSYLHLNGIWSWIHYGLRWNNFRIRFIRYGMR